MLVSFVGYARGSDLVERLGSRPILPAVPSTASGINDLVSIIAREPVIVVEDQGVATCSTLATVSSSRLETIPPPAPSAGGARGKEGRAPGISHILPTLSLRHFP